MEPLVWFVMIAPKKCPEIDFRYVEFPSDALSIKRFRKLFPENFDGPGLIEDSFANNNFFYPSGMGEPEHLMRLTQLIMNERVVVAGAFYRELEKMPRSLLDDEATW